MDVLHALMRDSAQRVPDQAVFLSDAHTTRYGELERASGLLSATLHELGVRRGDRVAVVLDGDVDYLVAWYGVLKAGAAAVPLCPDTRTESLVYALAHSEARVAILDASNLRYLDGQSGALPELRAVIVRGGGALAHPGHIGLVPWADALAPGREISDGGAGPADLAAIIYTSGTTGRPKGVMLAHRNLVANVRSIVSYLALTERDVAGMVLPYYYVYGNSVLHTHVAAGGTIAQLGSMTFVAKVVEGMQRHRCTGLSGVPATFARLCSFASFEKYDLSSLRYLTQAGAAMSPELVGRLRATFPKAQVFVMYGQTEAAARLSYVPPERLDEKPGSAGRAIPGVTLAVVNPDGVELPPGQVGEVVARGENVMLGYYRDPEASSRVLRPEGLRTGDIGYLDEEGFLYLKGRESELIKSGGHRISPVEIEHAIATAAGVQEVGVCGVPDPMLGEAIAAFVVAVPGAAITRRAIQDACNALLPRFKMPAHLRVVRQLPRTTTGKLQRRELVEWFAAGEGEEPR